MVICRNYIARRALLEKMKKLHTNNLTAEMKAVEQIEESIPKRRRQE